MSPPTKSLKPGNHRKQIKTLSRVVFGLLFVLAGANHFRVPAFYVAIMPPYLPFHRELVMVSGIAEIGLGGLLLFYPASTWAAWGLIALLIAVFPANLQMAQHPELYPWASPVALYLRLPLQFALIGWAYLYTRREK